MAGQIDTTLLATLMSEIDSPALQRKVMRLCVAAASADDYLADGEIALLAAVFNAWGPTPAAGRRFAAIPAASARSQTCGIDHLRGEHMMLAAPRADGVDFFDHTVRATEPAQSSQ